MREIVLDTETTGLDPAQGHRIVEIGAVELINHIPSGKIYHTYIDPQREMPPEAEAVHGLSSTFLKGKPRFPQIIDEFKTFLGEATLVIHNASFDLAFLNAEFALIGHSSIPPERIIDTLLIARQKHPMGPNSLDALCKRYGVDNSKREKHGALLDSELLAEVYLELIGGKQATLSLSTTSNIRRLSGQKPVLMAGRPRALTPRITDEELRAHSTLIAELGPSALWQEKIGGS